MDANSGRPSGYLLPQGENPRPLRTVLTEAQLNRSGGRGPARDAEVDKTKGSGLAEGVVRVEVAGTEIQAKVLRVLAREVAGGNRPDNLGECYAVEIRGYRRGKVVQAGSYAIVGIAR